MKCLYHGIECASQITDAILVMFSGGKDSVCVLDLCHRYFRRVQPVFMQIGPMLSFHKAMHAWAEDKYGVEILKLPHPGVVDCLRYGVFRNYQDFSIPVITFKDIWNYSRLQTGIWWIAAGEKIADSIVRRAMIKGDGGCVNAKIGRFYPLAEWTIKDVYAYMRQRRLRMTPEYESYGGSYNGSLVPHSLHWLKRHYPNDYEKMRAWFPFIDVATKRIEFFGE